MLHKIVLVHQDAAVIFGYMETIDTADSVNGLIEMLTKL